MRSPRLSLTLSLAADGLLDGDAAQLEVPLSNLDLVQLPLQLLGSLQPATHSHTTVRAEIETSSNCRCSS